jgi:hypothetical protein
MGPSQGQLRYLSPEDRITYKKWLRRSLMFYSTVLALLVVAIAVNHIFVSMPSELAGDMHTAAIARK